MNETLVRQARADDIPKLCQLLSELFALESDFTPDYEKQARGLELLLNNATGSSQVMVAETAGTIIGMCSVQTVISTAEGGPSALLEDLVVSSVHRQKGVGSRLLSEIAAWCISRNISRLQLLRDSDNSGALAFYTANGWDSTKLICMRKHL